MLVIKALHMITMVAWFAGLFYLPRLFVYHADAEDTISIERFKLMEWRLFNAITWPAAVLTTVFGVWLITYNPHYYLEARWMQAKLAMVILLWIFHLFCGHFVKRFNLNINNKSSKFYRMFNEIPTLLLVAIILLVVIKP